MEAKLTIQERLKDLRLEKGWTLSELAQKTGLSRSALGSYEQDDYKDISHRAIYRLAKCYGVSADYLLGLTENRTMINTPLSELHLNDEMVTLLREERINTRLLCEMASHDGFQRLMEDIEIYVDGHAAMAIGFLNEYYEQQRQLLLKNPNTTRDNFMRSIEAAANIDENAYFAMMIHNDIDEIIRDIHSRHKEDASTASKINISATITEALDESRAVQGSVFQRMSHVLLRLLGLDKDRASAEQRKQMADILKSSSYADHPTGQRGKQGNAEERTNGD